jgi:hypothetical protein
MKSLRLAALLILAVPFAPRLAGGDDRTGTFTTTGWISDEHCASAKKMGPNGRDCVQKCLKEGARMVFVDENAKALFFVDNPEGFRGQESHHVQISATLDKSGKSVHVASLKVLEPYVASCSVK